MTSNPAPERIWAFDDSDDESEKSWPLHWYLTNQDDGDGSFVGEYTRTDIADARVAAERERCARIAVNWIEPGMSDNSLGLFVLRSVAAAIRKGEDQ